MPKRITFSADEQLLAEARDAARSLNTTLNEQFRLWLEAFARKGRAERARQTVASLQANYSTSTLNLGRRARVSAAMPEAQALALALA